MSQRSLFRYFKTSPEVSRDVLATRSQPGGSFCIRVSEDGVALGALLEVMGQSPGEALSKPATLP